MLTILLIIVLILLLTGGGFGIRRSRRGVNQKRRDPVGRARRDPCRAARQRSSPNSLAAPLKQVADRSGERRDHGDRMERLEVVTEHATGQRMIACTRGQAEAPST